MINNTLEELSQVFNQLEFLLREDLNLTQKEFDLCWLYTKHPGDRIFIAILAGKILRPDEKEINKIKSMLAKYRPDYYSYLVKKI